MTVTEIAGLRFGEGRPKICVPLVGGNMPALLSELHRVRELPADLFEWRADCFFGSVPDALAALREGLRGKPLLCTVRTEGEGGKARLSPAEYEEKLRGLTELGGFQLIDLELAQGEGALRRLIPFAKSRGLGVVLSKHDFQKTPPAEEMRSTLLRMKALGGDLPKLAVTPRTPREVLELLEITLEVSGQIGPVITMAMGDLGKLTRVSGELFGSCLTFGAGQSASAPGQINAEDLKAILEDLSPHLGGAL